MKIEPVRVARARAIKDSHGQLTWKRVGDWVPYKTDGVKKAQDTTFAYDEYETADPTGADALPGDNPTYTGCGTAGSRYFFGDGYLPGLRYNDLHVVAGAKGKLSTRSFIAWYQQFDALVDFQYFFATTENFPDDVNGLDPNDGTAAGRGDYDGVVASFGAIPNGGGGYYYSDIDLDGMGFGWQLPTDGNGGTLYLNGDVDANNNITIIGQNMLWGVNPGNPTPPCSDLQWDDDVTVDLILTPDELYSYAYGLCPDPLGVMGCFLYSPGASTETLAPTGFSVGTSKLQSGNNASLAGDDNNAMVVCKFLVPNQTDIIKVTFNFTTTKSTPTAVALVSKSKMVAGGVFKYRAFQHNFAGNVDDQLGADVAITAAYNVFTNNASGTLTNYVGAANAMQSKILIRQTGPSVAAVPCVSFEYVNLQVTG